MPHKLFPSQQPNEKIYLVFREHWFRLAVKFSVVGLLMLIPVLIQTFLVDFSLMFNSDDSKLLISLIGQIYYLSLFLALFLIWVLYYLNLGVVTERRLVDIDQHGLLKHEVSELSLDSIQDVSSETIGIFGNLLDYGTVYIQTAGARERFEFDKIHHPKKVASIIISLHELRKRKGSRP
ncbi:MAG TPA: PH domain-containing protein [Candidatus Doudnabacteria bacterium]|nr:PH domain-containing protein [Candidatus Doudnabacteria bacterium]